MNVADSRRLAESLEGYGLTAADAPAAGVTIDLEDVPDKLQDSLFEFTREMRLALAPSKRLVTQTVHAEIEPSLPAGLRSGNGVLTYAGETAAPGT